MSIKTIPLSRLEVDPRGTLTKCADSGEALLVELPDKRLLVIHPLEASDEDSLVDDLIQSNPAFREMLAKSKGSPQKPFFRH